MKLILNTMRHFTAIALLFIALLANVNQGLAEGPKPERNFKVSGKVMDEDANKPLEYATVKLLQYSDSSMVTGIVTDKQGEFTIEVEKPGKYLLQINFIGYTKYRSTIELTKEKRKVDVGNVAMHPASKNIEGITVEGNRHAMDYKIDKKVLHVAKQYTSISGTAVDVLKNAPSIQVDIEGNVQLRGNSNFTVLIDDRPTVLSATDALEQVPASTIQDIEIITNPSAKYDPEGTAGIINIITKKRTLEGINGIAHLNLGLDEKYGGDLLLNYRNEKFNVFVGGDYNDRTYPGSVEMENRTYGDTTYYLTSEGSYKRQRKHYSVRGGIEWFPNERNTFSLTGRYGGGSWGGTSETEYAEWTSEDETKNRYTSIEDGERGGNFLSLKSDYTHKFERQNHQLDMQLSFYSRDHSEENISTLKNEDGEIRSSQKSTEAGPSIGLRYRVNYEQPFSERFKIEAGAQGRYRDSDESNDMFFYTNDGTYELQPKFSHEAEYMRNIHALYGLVKGEINNFGYQLGLRSEYTYRDITMTSTGDNFNIDRWDFFPTLHFSYNLTEKDQFMASYTRRIDRPRGWYLEPFITWRDAYNVRKGNPGLQPEYIDSYEAGYQKEFGKNAISLEAYYRTTENNIERIQRVYRENIMMGTFENVGNEYSLGTEIMLNMQPVKFWETNISGNFYDYRVKGQLNDVSFDKHSFTWSLRWNNIFHLWENTRIQLTPDYDSPEMEAQEMEEAEFELDGAIRQSFFNKKLNATLQVRDILNTGKHEETTDENDFYSYRLYTHKAPIVMLNITWRINNYKDRSGRRGGRDGGMEGGMEGGM